MQPEKNKKAAITFWVLSAICMGVIFYFSSRDAVASTMQSDVIVQWLKTHFGDSELWVLLVRKSAHCLEFTGLSLLLNFAFCYTRGKCSLPAAVGITSLYAATDEFHQQFVMGRSCELLDWGIDTFGAVLGAAGFLIILMILNAIIRKKRKK